MSENDTVEKMTAETAAPAQNPSKGRSGKRWGLFAVAIIVVAIVLVGVIVGISIYNTPENRLERQLQTAYKYLEAGNYELAALAFEQAILIDEKCIEAYAKGIEAYIKSGNEEKSKNLFERAIQQVKSLDEGELAKNKEYIVDIFQSASDVYGDDKEHIAEVMELEENYKDLLDSNSNTMAGNTEEEGDSKVAEVGSEEEPGENVISSEIESEEQALYDLSNTELPQTEITIENLSVTAEAAEVKVGETVQLAVTVMPINAMLVYTSDNASVATVSNDGIVTGVKAGTANITVTLTYGTKKVTAVAVVTVVEEDSDQQEQPDQQEQAEQREITIVSFEAVKANVLVASFAAAIDKDAVVKITKESQTADVSGDGKWNDDRTRYTYTTSANLTGGTYTITLTVGKEANKVEATASTKVDDQTVTIEILNTVALVSEDGKTAYAYYDVKDQYGVSVRDSVSISWTSTATIGTVDTARGRIELKVSGADKVFTYGQMIFLTGVYAKGGQTVTAQLTLGLRQVVSEIEFAGIVKKGSSQLIQTLPKNFEKDTYYVLYCVKDQNGNMMKADNYIGKQEVIFITKQPLIIENITEGGAPIIVDGVAYSAALVQPGIMASEGGDVEIEAIALNFANKTLLKLYIG